MNTEGLWDGAYGLSSICICHYKDSIFLLCYLKTLSVGPVAVFEPVTSRTVPQCQTNWANRSAIKR